MGNAAVHCPAGFSAGDATGGVGEAGGAGARAGAGAERGGEGLGGGASAFFSSLQAVSASRLTRGTRERRRMIIFRVLIYSGRPIAPPKTGGAQVQVGDQGQG